MPACADTPSARARSPLSRATPSHLLALRSLGQLPLADLMRTRAIQGQAIGNVFVWLGLVGGVALVTALYARELPELRGAPTGAGASELIPSY